MDKSLIQTLKKNLSECRKLTTSDESIFYFRMLHRGEQLFACHNDRGLIIDIGIHDNWADFGSIKKWDDGTVVSENEKILLFECIQQYWKIKVNPDHEVVAVNGKTLYTFMQ